jgi:hypothetical protein
MCQKLKIISSAKMVFYHPKISITLLYLIDFLFVLKQQKTPSKDSIYAPHLELKLSTGFTNRIF